MTTSTFENTMQVVGRYADGKLLAGRMDRIGVVLFNQPDKRNALSLEMWDGIRQALDLFASDNGVRVVVYAGAGGKAFTRAPTSASSKACAAAQTPTTLTCAYRRRAAKA